MAVTPIAEAVISSLKCRTPRAGEWVRVNPDPSWQSEAVLARDQDGEYYLVTPELADELLEARPDRVHRSMLFIAANSEGVGFLWPVKLPVPEAHLAHRAMREWVCFPSETRLLESPPLREAGSRLAILAATLRIQPPQPWAQPQPPPGVRNFSVRVFSLSKT